MFNLASTPYQLDKTASKQVKVRLDTIEERVSLLRYNGALTEQTIKDYYGEKRFEQVAESNAIEGSTLSVGETELAVLKGITITGHDPAFTRDAIALDRALARITELARDVSTPTDIQQLHEIHGLLLGDRPGAGIFRRERVCLARGKLSGLDCFQRDAMQGANCAVWSFTHKQFATRQCARWGQSSRTISPAQGIALRGAKHTPPKTWEQIMSQMSEWQDWSANNQSLPAPIRSAVMHAWLTHIHPYIDGNGRTSRAIGNLELIRAGYPPIIIKKKERDRYIDALAESDEGGDIRSFLELVFDRIDGGLFGLEQSAKRRQGYDPVIEKIRVLQEKQLNIWHTSVKLLASIIEHRLSQRLESVGGVCAVKLYDNPLDLEDYIEVCAGHSVAQSWAFIVRLDIPGISRLEKLAYIGHRSPGMFQSLNQEGGPSLYWSHNNPDGFPKWLSDGPRSPYAVEISSKVGNGDEWFARLGNDSIERVQTTALASRIADALVGEIQRGEIQR